MSSSKKLKFASVAEEQEFYQEYDTEIADRADSGDGSDSDSDKQNDLDLDTIRARSRTRQLKDIDDDDDDEEEEESDFDFDNGSAKEAGDTAAAKEAELNWDSESDSSGEADIGNDDDDAEFEFAAAQSKYTLNDTTEQQQQQQDDLSDDVDDRQVPLEPFSLKADREEGTFDSEGFFIRAIDQDADQDRWLANLTQSDISKARRAHEKTAAARKALAHERARQEAQLTVQDAYAELLSLMQPGQTVLAAIRSKSAQGDSSAAQQSSTAPRRPPLNKNRLKKLASQSAASAVQQSSSHSDPAMQQQLNRITELADLLMNRGIYGVYEETFEEISDKVNKARQ